MALGSGDLAPQVPAMVGAATGASAHPVSDGRIRHVAVHVLVVAVALPGAYFFGPLLGMALPVAALAILGAGALAAEVRPGLARPIAVATGFALMVRLNPVYGCYHAFVVLILYACRRHPWRFATAVILLAIVIPKASFWKLYQHPGFYNWFNESALAMVIFVSATWWRELRSGRLPAGAQDAPLRSWATLYLFPTHAANPMVFGPRDLARREGADPRAVLTSLALVATKAIAHTGLWAALPGLSYPALSPTTLMGLPTLRLWIVVAANYLDLVLVLSGTADLAIMFARLYGWPLASPFRWALLAWNPVELWRRWGIYNRRFLLTNVYFPLGGNRQRPYLNILLTFLASAWVLHSGWFGSKYPTVGTGGWRDEAVYFLLQGAAVCGCLLYFQLTGKGPRDDTALAWRWSRVPATVATQAMSALVHVVILVQSVELGDRWRLIGRCLGL